MLGGLAQDPVWLYRNALLRALGTSIGIAAVAVAVGLGLGFVLVLLGRGRSPLARYPAVAFIELWRNTPLLVQLMWVHFALPLVTGLAMAPLTSGLVALSCNAGAYFAEILRAGVDAVPRGQWEAARALGLRPVPQWLRVIGPQVLRLVLPAAVNMTVSIFKGTTILSVLQVGEFVQVVTRVSNFTFRHVEVFTVALLAYIVLAALLDGAAGVLERRLRRGLPA